MKVGDLIRKNIIIYCVNLYTHALFREFKKNKIKYNEKQKNEILGYKNI